jgi:hypothetical protein
LNSPNQKIENTLNAAKLTDFPAKEFYKTHTIFVISELILNKDNLEGLIYDR